MNINKITILIYVVCIIGSLLIYYETVSEINPYDLLGYNSAVYWFFIIMSLFVFLSSSILLLFSIILNIKSDKGLRRRKKRKQKKKNLIAVSRKMFSSKVVDE